MTQQFDKKNVCTASAGFGLIEIIVATAIVTLALSAFLHAGATAIRLLRAEKENLMASILAKEGLNAVRAIRDESWTTIAGSTIGATYYPLIESGKWKLSSTDPGVLNGLFTRTIVFDRVYRNSSDQISSAGTEDPGTRRATVRILWNGKTYQIFSYFTDFQSHLSLSTESKTLFFEDAPTDTNFAAFPSPNTGSGDPSQSFTTAGSIDVTKIELLLRRTTPAPSHAYAELRTSATGTVLAMTNMLNGSGIASTSPAWVEFRFETPVSLAAATKYYIRLRSRPASTDAGSGSAGIINWSYRQSSGGPFAGGEAYTGIGQLSNPLDSGTQQNDYDFGFRVYTLQ
ncbi:MAG: hypothetical protein HYT37_03690 [Candidatus Sungbacteria bacterium]|nr:hypothetical protein [Candidatus Sungbacteria bacterium]